MAPHRAESASAATMTGNGGASPAALEPALAGIWQHSLGEIMARLDALDRVQAAWQTGPVGQVQLHEARRAAHTLAGSLGMFGLANASRLSRAVEDLIGEVGPDATARPRLAPLLHALRAQVARGPDGTVPVPTAAASSRERVLVVVGDDDTFVDALADVTAPCGLRTVPLPRLDASLPESDGDPDAVLVDVRATRDDDAAVALLEQACTRWPAVPVLALTTGSGPGTTAPGAHLFPELDDAMAPGELLDRLLEGMAPDGDTMTVLAVDDDPAVLEGLAAALASPRVRLHLVSEPQQLPDALERHRPDLLLLDVDMPGTTGPQLCRALRRDRRWATLPVLFLTAYTDRGTVRESFAAGADDFLAKTSGPELARRITRRLESIRLLRQAPGVLPGRRPRSA